MLTAKKKSPSQKERDKNKFAPAGRAIYVLEEAACCPDGGAALLKTNEAKHWPH